MTTHNRLSKKSVAILKLISEGHSYSQIVDGQKEDTYPDVFKAAEEALELNESKSDYKSRIESIKNRYSMAYERWTKDEDVKLEELHRQGETIKKLVEIFQRQPSAIISRLEKLGYTDRLGN